ncbi:MAG: DUF3368 domain-containing protein [Sedimenticola sp.]
MTDVVVSDAGPLIALGASGLLPELGNLFRVIYIPPAVEQEVLCDLSRPGAPEINGALVNDLLTRKRTSDKQALKALTELLDPGEAEALALAGELGVAIILDEKKGRRVAKKRGITPVGTGAILIKMKQKGIIKIVEPYLDLLRSNGYRLSPQLCQDILALCGEDSSQTYGG